MKITFDTLWIYAGVLVMGFAPIAVFIILLGWAFGVGMKITIDTLLVYAGIWIALCGVIGAFALLRMYGG